MSLFKVCKFLQALTILHQFLQVIADKHEDVMAKLGAILAQGIIDAGGRNMTVSLQSRTGHTNMMAVVGMLVSLTQNVCINISNNFIKLFFCYMYVYQDPPPLPGIPGTCRCDRAPGANQLSWKPGNRYQDLESPGSP